MTEIISTRQIPHTPAKVFAIAQDVSRFPEVMPNLDAVQVLEDDGDGQTVTRWEASFTVGPMSKRVIWTERDHWNEDDLSCTFELVEGDMQQYNGKWTFTANGDGCLAELQVCFELGIPMLGPLITKIVNQLMQQNCDSLLEALEELASQ